MKVLYHENCNDGSGAALAVWMACGDEGHEYIPVQYGSPPPDGLDGQDVLMVDFSYKRDVIVEMARSANSILILDHHKGAEEELKDFITNGQEEWKRNSYSKSLCDVDVVFNMDKSGAVLAWEHFHSIAVPDLLLHIQDRDLWRFQLRDTKSVSAALQIYPNWRDWQRFIYEPCLLVTELSPKGQSIVAFLAQQSAKMVLYEPVRWPLCDVVVPLYNLPEFMISDTLHQALEKYPESPYAVAYFDLPEGKRVYSLRSRQGTDVDVSEIARSFGGSGHKHAAGFTVETF